MKAAELLRKPKPPARAGVARKPAQKQTPRKRSGGREFAPHVCVYLQPEEIERTKTDAKNFGYSSLSEYVRAALTKFRQVCNNG